MLLDAVSGAYRAIAGAGHEVEFVSFAELDRLEARLLVLPFTVLLPGRGGLGDRRLGKARRARPGRSRSSRCSTGRDGRGIAGPVAAWTPCSGPASAGSTWSQVRSR